MTQNRMRNCTSHVFPSNLQVIGLMALSIASSFISIKAASSPVAFVTHTASSSGFGERHLCEAQKQRNAIHRTWLFVDGGDSANGEFSKQCIPNININAIESTSNGKDTKTNEWGIPDIQTLPPLGKIDDKGNSIPSESLKNGGRVTLVGSGPGDPDLLTLKAYKLLQDPSALVICDRLVSDEIKDVVKGDIMVARKLPGCAEAAQQEIYHWTYQGLQAGKHVIRLKIGDPFVFGRGGEEVLTFRQFGVEPKVVPVSLVAFVES